MALKVFLDFVTEFWKIILNSTLLVAVVGLWFQARKERLDRQREQQQVQEAKAKDTLSRDVKTANKVYVILWRLLADAGSKRVFVFQFHNGGSYFSGKGMKRATMSHEVSAFNIPRISADFQGHVMNDAFHNGLRELMDTELMYYPSVDNLPECGTKSMLRTYGSKAFFAVLFWDHGRKDPIGCLCLCFDKEHPLTDTQQADLHTRSEDVLHLLRD